MCDLNDVFDDRLKAQNNKYHIAKEIINGNTLAISPASEGAISSGAATAT